MENFSCGCVNAPTTKEPECKRSEVFEDVSASLAIHHGGPVLQARYSWLLEAHKSLPASAYIEAEFENPVRGEAPVITRGMEVKGDNKELKRFYFLSPNLDHLECRDYDMTANVYTDRSKKHLIAQHKNQVRSSIDTVNCPTAEFMERMSRMQAEWKATT